MHRADPVRHEIIPPFKEVKDDQGRIYLHMPLYIDTGPSPRRQGRASNATLAYPVYSCVRRENKGSIMVIGSLSHDGSTIVKAARLYSKPVESSVRVYALPLHKICRKAASANRPDYIRGLGGSDAVLCMPGFAVANRNIYEYHSKTVFLYLFNVGSEDDCDDLRYVYYSVMRLKLEQSNTQEPKHATMHIIIASKDPLKKSPDGQLPREINKVKEQGCALRVTGESGCPRYYKIKHMIWPPVAMIKDKGRTGYVKSSPAYLTLLISAHQGTGSLVNKLIGGTIEIRRKASDMASETFYVPSSVFFSAWRGQMQGMEELGILSNAVERVYSNILVVESEPIDYTVLYDRIRIGVGAAFQLLAECVDNDMGLLGKILEKILGTAWRMYGEAFGVELPSSDSIIDLRGIPGHELGEDYSTTLLDPKLLAKILLNNATARASLSDARRGKSLARYMSPVRFKHIINVKYPVTMLLPGARKVHAGTGHKLAYTTVQYNGVPFTRFGQLSTAAARHVRSTCKHRSRLEQDTLIVLTSWMANAARVYYSTYKDGPPLTISVIGMASTAALIGSIAGLHALSHMQMRRVSSKYRIGRRTIREYIIMTAPSDAVSGIQTAIGAQDTAGVILQGGIEVWNADTISTPGRMQAWILTMDTQEGSGYVYKRQDQPVSLSELLEELVLYTGRPGQDSCYVGWIPRASRLRSRVNAYMRTILSGSGNSAFAEIIDKAKSSTLEAFSLHYASGDVGSVFYPPIEVVQRVIEKRIYRLRVERQAATGLGYSFLIGHFVRSVIPDCFDSCYNCVLDEYCFIHHGDLQRMLTSKSAARILESGLSGAQASPVT